MTDMTGQISDSTRKMELFGVGLLIVVLILKITDFNLFPSHSGMANFANQGREVIRGGESAGSVRTRIILTVISFFSLFPIFYRFDRVKVIMAASLPLLPLIIWCGLSLLWAPDLGIGSRRYIRFLMVFVMALGIAVSVTSPRTLLLCLAWVVGALMVTNFAGAYLFSGSARDFEGNFLGVWHGHKNSSGALAAYAMIIWIACARHAQSQMSRWIFRIGAALWFVFLFNTGSKTGLFVGIFAPIFAMLFVKTSGKYSGVSYLFIFLSIMCFLLFYIFSLYLFEYSFMETVEYLIPGFDTTFTGRTHVWDFMFTEIANHPIVGHGFASFWGIGDQSPAALRGTGTVIKIVQAHNGYIDIVAAIGAIGMIAFLLYYFSILRNVVRASRGINVEPSYIALVEIFAGLFVGTSVYNLTESGFMRGGVGWFLFVLSGFLLCMMISLATKDQPQRSDLRV